MPRYFLTRIRVEGFRGINNEANPLDLRFRPQAVNSVFAVNGIGKSSIFEALSYAIRGSIPKLDVLLDQEHADDYYCNRFHSRKHAIIDLDFEPDDGSSIAISIHVERNNAGRRTVSSPSGHPNPEVFLAALNEDFTLLDYRTFSHFIDDSPLERGRSFSALLGLSAYSDMRQSLQAASDTRSLKNDLKTEVIGTSIKASQQASQQALVTARLNYERVTGETIDDVDRLDECQDKVSTALGNVELLKSHFQGKRLADVDFDALKKAIREAEGGEKRKELERVIESLTGLEALGASDPATTKEEQQKLLGLLEERDALLSATRGDLFKRLYETADSLISQGLWTDDSTCPLCLSPLETSIKVHIDDQLGQYRGVVEKISEIKQTSHTALWTKRLAVLEKAAPLAVQEADRIAEQLCRNITSGQLTSGELAVAVTRLTTL